MLDAPSFGEKRYPALFTAIAAVVGLPFYLGLVHLPLTHLTFYSGVASTAMATGQFVDTPSEQKRGLPVFLYELALWFALIVVIGGLSYLIALIF